MISPIFRSFLPGFWRKIVIFYAIGGLEHEFHFSISYMGCHPSHWLSLHHFSRWLVKTTNQIHYYPSLTIIKPLLCENLHFSKQNPHPQSLSSLSAPGSCAARRSTGVKRWVIVPSWEKQPQNRTSSLSIEPYIYKNIYICVYIYYIYYTYIYVIIYVYTNILHVHGYSGSWSSRAI